MMFNLKNKTVVIIGAQKSGFAAAKLVYQRGGKVKISEYNSKEKISEEFLAWIQENAIACQWAGHTQDFIEDSDLIVLSPGVAYESLPVQWAMAKKIPVLGEIELAVQFCEKPIIAVTGSNGKTTVSTLIHEVIQKSGKRSVLCGNVGNPFSGCVSQCNDADYVVVEISSFQLESLIALNKSFRKFKPYIAVFLNFSQNHLDRHKDLQEYFDAKKKIFLNQDKKDFAVLNFKDSSAEQLMDAVKAQVCYFNQQSNGINPNQSAALKVAQLLGIQENICHEVFKSFKGVEHRLEWVRDINGVDYINDSKATTAEAGRWAIESIKQPIVLICGGRDKNIDFSVLCEVVKKNVKKMFVFGEAKIKLQETFKGFVEVELCENLNDAVSKSSIFAKEGDCILLSPMCASFDMFTNFEERGSIYKKIVGQL